MIVMLVMSAGAQTVCYYLSQTILNSWTADHGMNEAKWLPIYLFLAMGNAAMYGFTAWTSKNMSLPFKGVLSHRSSPDFDDQG